MKGFCFIAAMLVSSVGFAGIGARTTTEFKTLTKIDIQVLKTKDGTAAFYYFYPNATRWAASDCPNADRAFIAASDAGAKEILAVALTAKATGKKIQFQGICGNSELGGTSDWGMYINLMSVE